MITMIGEGLKAIVIAMMMMTTREQVGLIGVINGVTIKECSNLRKTYRVTSAVNRYRFPL